MLTNRGFTLLEVIASITILTIILTSFFMLFTQGMLFSVKTENKFTSVNIARDVLIVLQDKTKVDNENINNTGYSPYINNDFFNTNNVQTLDFSANPKLAVELFNDTNPPFIITVNNTAYYPEVKNITHTSEDKARLISLNLYAIHISVFDSPDFTQGKIISETYGLLEKD